MPEWKNYEELRPDQLEAQLEESPIAFWPLGLLEHHGWHLPIGFDGIKAQRYLPAHCGANGWAHSTYHVVGRWRRP